MRSALIFTIITITIFITDLSKTEAEATPISLGEAEILALENDPMLASFGERKRAMQATAIANSQLPDPSFKIGVANLPIDSFNLSQEPMTQLQLGLSQRFPRGDTLRLNGDRAKAKADVQSQKQNLRLRETLLEVRGAWLDAYYWQSTIAILLKQKNALDELVGVTQAHYAEAMGQQQDVLRSQLEFSLLRDKIINAERQYSNALAGLQKWIGGAKPVVSVASSMPNFAEPKPLEQIREILLQHPVVAIGDAEINVQKTGVGLAKQAYKPEWGVDLNYGARSSDVLGNSRSDFVSLMVKVDIPFFTGKRQDKRLSAAKYQEAATRFERDEKIRNLGQMLDNDWSNWKRSGERLALYSDEIMAQSAQTYAVTLNAYRNQVAGFELLIRARLLDFDTKIQTLALATEHKKAQARLLYLQGEE
jgi:outer membrane protein TolC